MTSENEKYKDPTLEKGLDIIELLPTTSESISQREIASALSRLQSEIENALYFKYVEAIQFDLRPVKATLKV